MSENENQPKLNRLREQYQQGLISEEEYNGLCQLVIESISNTAYPPFNVPLDKTIKKPNVVIPALVVSNFVAQNKNQINLEKNDKVKIFKKFGVGWDYGEINGRRGYFPHVCVREEICGIVGRKSKGTLPTNFIQKETHMNAAINAWSGTATKKNSIQAEKLHNKKKKKDKKKWRKSVSVEPTEYIPFPGIRLNTDKDFTLVESQSTTSRKIKSNCFAICNFNGDKTYDQISFQKGQEIELLNSYNNGWSKGECEKEIGYFPSAFVAGIEIKKSMNLADDQLDMKMECFHCKKKGGIGVDLMRCSKCKSALYCNSDCQMKHWKDHKTTCSIKDLEEQLNKENEYYKRKLQEIKSGEEVKENKRHSKGSVLHLFQSDSSGVQPSPIVKKTVPVDKTYDPNRNHTKTPNQDQNDFLNNEEMNLDRITDEVFQISSSKQAETKSTLKVPPIPIKNNQPVKKGNVKMPIKQASPRKNMNGKENVKSPIYKQVTPRKNINGNETTKSPIKQVSPKKVVNKESPKKQLPPLKIALNTEPEKKPLEKETKQWQVGDKVLGLYREDGLWYKATIQKVAKDQKYLIIFDDYGNTQQNELHEIVPLPKDISPENTNGIKSPEESTIVKTNHILERGSEVKTPNEVLDLNIILKNLDPSQIPQSEFTMKIVTPRGNPNSKMIQIISNDNKTTEIPLNQIIPQKGNSPRENNNNTTPVNNNSNGKKVSPRDTNNTPIKISLNTSPRDTNNTPKISFKNTSPRENDTPKISFNDISPRENDTPKTSFNNTSPRENNTPKISFNDTSPRENDNNLNGKKVSPRENNGNTPKITINNTSPRDNNVNEKKTSPREKNNLTINLNNQVVPNNNNNLSISSINHNNNNFPLVSPRDLPSISPRDFHSLNPSISPRSNLNNNEKLAPLYTGKAIKDFEGVQSKKQISFGGKKKNKFHFLYFLFIFFVYFIFIFLYFYIFYFSWRRSYCLQRIHFKGMGYRRNNGQKRIFPISAHSEKHRRQKNESGGCSSDG